MFDSILFGLGCIGLAWLAYAVLDLAEAIHRRHIARLEGRRCATDIAR